RETANRSAQTPAVPATTGTTGAIGAAEVADARAMAEAGEAGDMGDATTSAKYVSMSRMQLSDDPAGLPSDERQAALGDPANNWTTSQTTFEQLPVEAGAALGLDAGATLTESTIHAHEESGYRSTDSYEVDRSIGPNAPAAPALDDAYTIPAPPEAPPAGEIAMDASTWPDYPPVAPVEATPAAEPLSAPTPEPSATDALGAEALGAGAFGLGAWAAVPPEAAPAAGSRHDVTDAPTDAVAAPVADVAFAGATPVHITLPEAPAAVEMAPLYLAPEEPATAPFTPFATPEYASGYAPEYPSSGWDADESSVAPQDYVPPTVPLDDAAPFAAEPAAFVGEPSQPAPQVNDRRESGETLAELAGFAGLAGVGALVGAALTHAEPVTPVTPVTPDPVAFEPPTAPEPAPTPTPPADPHLIVGEGGQLMKVVRVKRRLVVDGEVISEEVREEIVPVDMDTTTAAAQLQASFDQNTAEEIARKAHLAPDEIDLRRRTEGGGNAGG
ncbi:MAG: hypothetical protein ABI068_10880, partial [Ktedonobacterales bacterium]